MKALFAAILLLYCIYREKMNLSNKNAKNIQQHALKTHNYGFC